MSLNKAAMHSLTNAFSASQAFKYDLGHSIGHAYAEFNVSSQKPAGTYTLGLKLPAGAIVLQGLVDVVTTFTSATDAATIALRIQSANDLVSAIAISNGANPWDAGLKATVPVDTAATAIKLTAEREVQAVVAVETLTAGKLRVYVRYYLPTLPSF